MSKPDAPPPTPPAAAPWAPLALLPPLPHLLSVPMRRWPSASPCRIRGPACPSHRFPRSSSHGRGSRRR